MRPKETNSDLTIQIKAGSPDAIVSLKKENGTVEYKSVDLENLISALAATHKVNTGILPKNTRFFCGTLSRYRIGLETMPRMRDFGLFSRSVAAKGKKHRILRIPFPPCLFVFDVRTNKIRLSRVFALRGTLSRENDELCVFPFGNVYAGGDICWGSANLPRIKTPMNLIGVISIFLDSAFNGDLYRGRTNLVYDDGSSVRGFWDLVKYLDGKETFPDRGLKTSTTKLQSLVLE
jgi:hypothetical protein